MINPPSNDDVFLGRWVANNKRSHDSDDEKLKKLHSNFFPAEIVRHFVKKKHYLLPLFGLGGNTKNIHDAPRPEESSLSRSPAWIKVWDMESWLWSNGWGQNLAKDRGEGRLPGLKPCKKTSNHAEEFQWTEGGHIFLLVEIVPPTVFFSNCSKINSKKNGWANCQTQGFWNSQIFQKFAMFGHAFWYFWTARKIITAANDVFRHWMVIPCSTVIG